MGIRLKPEAKEEFRQLYAEAVKLQVELYDKLGEIENVDGVGTLSGLDDAVREEAANWVVSEEIRISEKDINFVLRSVGREP
jgi:hypothetical protein